MHHPPPPTAVTGLDWLANRFDAYQGVLKQGLGLAAALAFVFSALCHALGGKTPGKRLLGVVLVDKSGRPPPIGVCVVRAALSLVSMGLLSMGFFMAFFDRRRRALHDQLSGTYVVRILPAPH